MVRLKKFAALLLSAAMVMTSFEVPAYAETGEEIVVEADSNAEGAVWAESDDSSKTNESSKDAAAAESQEAPSEDITGAYTRYHIYSEADLVSALNGFSKLPAVLEADIEVTKPLVVNEDTTLDLNGMSIVPADSYEVSSNKLMTLTVEKDKSLTLSGGDYQRNELALCVINKGTYRQGNIDVAPLYGTPFVNEAGAEAVLSGYFYFNAQASDKAENVIINSGTLTVRDCRLYSRGSLSGVDIWNRQGASLRCFNYADAVSVKNNGSLLVRGEIDMLYNEGKDAVAELGDDAYIRKIHTYNEAAVQMNAGYVEELNMDEQISVSSASAAPGGMFTMAGGQVDRIQYIANRPKLIGGCVGEDSYRDYYSYEDVGGSWYNNAAILHYAKTADGRYSISYNTAQYIDEKDTVVSARQHQMEYFCTEDGQEIERVIEVPATSIVDGVVNDMEVAEESDTKIVVSGNAALVEAIKNAPADGTRTSLVLSGPYDTAAISENVVVKKGQNISIRARSYTSTSILFAKDMTLTVEEGASLSLSDDNLQLVNTENETAFLINRGQLVVLAGEIRAAAGQVILNEGENAEVTLQGMQIDPSAPANAAKYTAVANKKGKVNIKDAEINMDSAGGTMVENQGEAVLESVKWEISAVSVNGIVCEQGSTTTLTGRSKIDVEGKDTIPVRIKNGASFVVGDDSHIENSSSVSACPYAIVYEGEAIPVLLESEVRSFSQTSEKAGDGFAVAKADGTGKYESGSVEGPGGKTDTKKANEIINGVPLFATEGFRLKNRYALLKVGETYSVSENMVDYVTANYQDFKVAVADDKNGVLEHDQNGNVKALKAGYAVVKVYAARRSDSTMEKVNEVADYMRIEVTDQDIKDLTADDFEGVLLEPQMKINAYAKSNSLRYGFHLKSSSETMTGGNNEIDSQTYRPSRVYTDDDEFNQYFSVGFISNWQEKNYFCTFRPICRNGMPTAAEAGVKSISDIHFYADLENENGDMVRRVPLGTMNLAIDQKKPSVKFKAITLNSAYKSFEEGNMASVWTSYTGAYAVDEFTDFVLSDGLVWHEDQDWYAYAGTAKTAKLSVKLNYTLSGYYGTYEASIPVNVINKKPKVSFVQKKISVAQKAAEAGNVCIPLASSTKSDFSKIASIQLEENPYYEAYSNGYVDEDEIEQIGKNYVYSDFLYLKQKMDLPAKGVKLDFTVNYRGLKPDKKGKTSVTKLTLSVKPGKFSVKTSEKSYFLKTEPYEDSFDSIVVEINTTPSNFINGIVKVSDLDGMLSVSGIWKNGDGNYEAQICANEKTRDIKAKKVLIPVSFCDNAGKEMASGKIAVMLDSSEYSISLKKSELKMDINKEAVFYGRYWGDRDEMWHSVNQTDEAMRISLPVKKTGKRWMVYFECSDPRFESSYHKGTYGLKPTMEALEAGAIAPGKEYKMTLTFYDTTGKPYEVALTVKTSDIKTVKTAADRKQVTLYRDAPYGEASIGLMAVKPFNAVIQSVKCEDENFEIRADRNSSSYQIDNFRNYKTFYIGFKDHNSKGKAAKKYKVKLTVTYTNGKTGTVTVTVDAKNSK